MPLAYSESVLSFACEDEHLLGIVSTPQIPDVQAPTRDVGVIIVVGGPQYRAGSHRLFVSLARSLAQAGFTALRFDYRGMGDSGGAARDFEGVTPDIKAAIDALLTSHAHLKRVVLWGLCDGASASLLYCDDTQDARVCGLVLLNPWVRSAESLARTQVKHYYWQRLRQAAFWHKLLSGRLGLQALRALGANLRLATKAPQASTLGFQARMARAWRGFKAPILLVLSGEDYTAKEFIEHAESSSDWHGLLYRVGLEQRRIAGADHTFSQTDAATGTAMHCQQWLQQCWPEPQPDVVL